MTSFTLDIKSIREHPEKLKEALEKRGDVFDVDYMLGLDEKRRAKMHEVDELRAKQNKFAEEIAGLSGREREEAIGESRELKQKLGDAEFELKVIGQEYEELFAKIPNPPFDDVPVGKNENDNVVLREVGERPAFSFAPKDHLALGTALGIIDFETGAKVAGSNFYYLKNEGVFLELALVRYALDFLAKKSFSLWLTPDLARSRFYLGTGYLPRGSEAQTFVIEGADLGLIATAEVALAGIHADEILDEKKLPLHYAGYSHCFRQEGGSYGKYSRGLYRVHQFTKVEMFLYSTPEDSTKLYQELLAHEEALWQELGIPYRVVEMCTADLGTQAAKKHDLEAWMPGRGDWGEVTSASHTTDYQARRLNIRYRAKDGTVQFVHTLNGTAIATSRAIVAILENYQNEDGSVTIPGALRPYMGGTASLKRK